MTEILTELIKNMGIKKTNGNEERSIRDILFSKICPILYDNLGVIPNCDIANMIIDLVLKKKE